MAYKNLQEFMDVLEKENELIRIKEYVDPNLEMAEITDRISKSKDGGKALLFENTGYDFPVLMNAYGSEKRMCLALGVNDLNDTAKEIENLFHLLSSPKENIIDKLKLLPKLGQFASWMPKVMSGRGECQAHSFFTSVSIHQHRKIVTYFFEKQCLSSIFTFAYPVSNFGNFQMRIYIFFYANKFIFFFKNIHKFLQIFVSHFAKILEAELRINNRIRVIVNKE